MGASLLSYGCFKWVLFVPEHKEGLFFWGGGEDLAFPLSKKLLDKMFGAVKMREVLTIRESGLHIHCIA